MSEEQSDIGANTASSLDQATAPTYDIPEKFGGDVNKLVDSYNQLESKIGSMYSLPSEDSSAEKWQEFDQKITSTGRYLNRPDPSNQESMDKFYNSLGRPESPDKYSLSIDDNVKPYLDQNTMSNYQQVAHQIGLTNEQANGLMNFEIARMHQQAEYQTEAKQNAEQQLRQTWGPDYDNRMAGAKSALNYYAEKYPDAANELMNGPAGNNPAFIAMLSELGSSLQESGHAGPVQNLQYGMSSEDAREKIAEIRDNPQHAFHDATNPGHGQAVAKMQKLYSIAFPEG
jgi:hypothetical protein